MAKLGFFGTLLASGILLYIAYGPPVGAHSPTNPQEVIVHMNEAGFEPKELTIKQGQTVVFENTSQEAHWPASNIHPTHQIYPEFDARRPIAPNQSWGFTFDKTGEWKYHDHLFPENGGTIKVSGQINEQKTSFLQQIITSLRSLWDKLISAFSSRTGLLRKAEPSASSNVPFKKPEKADLSSINQQFPFNCQVTDLSCISGYLNAVTDQFGPETALEILKNLQQEGKVASFLDDHQLAHRVGRKTADVFGTSAQAFLLCPMSAYNGGCQHGYFEQVLGETATAKEAAEKICESLGEGYSSKFKFYCYHGVGHGVMMAKANDLSSSLTTCDSLSPTFAQDGCWQGVFMENTNTGMAGKARAGIFSSTDPLAPCNAIEDKYRHECYINHAGWLVSFFKNNLKEAAASCLKAEKYVHSCLQSLGLMVSNPSWQPALVKTSSHEVEKIAWQLCQEFPQGFIDQCVLGAVDNIQNFNEQDISQPARFCSLVDPLYQNGCYQKIGVNLRNQIADTNLVKEKCATLGSFEKTCLGAAGL